MYVTIGGTDGSFAMPYALNDNNWHYLAATYDGSGTVTAYLDGQLVSQSGSYGTPSENSAAPLTVGADTSPHYFQGSIDEVAVYSGVNVLTSQKVNTHWRVGEGGPACASAGSTGYAGAVMANSPLRYYSLRDRRGAVRFEWQLP